VSGLYKKLGDFIRVVDNRNKDLKVKCVRGVSTQKKFIQTVANMSNISLENYKIVKKRQFVYVADTSRRGDKIALAYNGDKSYLVSSIYTVFEIIDTEKLLPEYLFLYFNRSEFDRYTRFNSWGSARETFTWDDMCDIKLPIPDIDTQKKYVAIYNNLVKNQKVYEKSLEYLEFVCNEFMNNLKDGENKDKLGNYIKLVDIRNENYEVKNLVGLNVDKEFMPSKAKTTDVNLSKYKILSKGQFLYSPMQVGRDKTVRVSLYQKDEKAIVSPAYYVFQLNENKILLNEFLMLWFYRPEFNRYGWFLSDGSVRASLDWDRFCEIKIPIPDIEKQKAIVNIYKVLQKRKEINERLKNSLKPLCPVLIRGVVEEVGKE
jgi:type I restriction enzyme S subunit